MKNSRFLALSLVIVLLDQLSKFLITIQLQLGDSLRVTSFFAIVRAHNYGAAFSFLNIPGGMQRWLFVGLSFIISVVLLAWLRKSTQKWQSLAIALVLGGAVGNLCGRLIRGYVVDFLDFHWHIHHWPAFNVADSAVCVGVILLILQLILQKDKP